jgi:hypothetical protein
MQLIPWIFLAIQSAIVFGSLLGYGIFTSRPDLLMQVDPQARFLPGRFMVSLWATCFSAVLQWLPMPCGATAGRA